VTHHSAALTKESGDVALAEAVASGRFEVGGERIDAMCRYAVTLTRAPGRTDPTILDGMRAVGLTAHEIIDVNQVVAYFNYVNRIAQGLGVELEPHWHDDVRRERDYDVDPP